MGTTTARIRFAQVVALIALLAVALVARPDGRVGACSCSGTLPTVADQVGQADIAFVGRLLDSETIERPEVGYTAFDLRYELLVEDAVKGVEVGDHVTMFGDTVGDTCGTSELDESAQRHAIVTRDYNFDGRFVADSTPPCVPTPSIDGLLAVDRTLPETSPGPVSVVVTGRLGEAELIAFDERGLPVAYGDVPSMAGWPAVCPTSERLVQLEQASPSEAPELVTRQTATLQVVDRREFPFTEAPLPEWVMHFLTGAELTCLTASGDDAVAVLPWESASDGRTRVVRVRPDEAGGTTVAEHDHASQAQYDPVAGRVVAVADGALVGYAIDGSDDSTTIARLTDATGAEGELDAVFLEPDGDAGWWVGMGVGDYGVATNLRLLTHVDADGRVERWPVTPPVEAYDPTIEHDVIRTGEHSIPLPAAGSSGEPVVPTESPPDDVPDELRLTDGRSLRSVQTGDISSVELIGIDGTATTLAHLFEFRNAVAVPDGPSADPASIEREPTDELVESRWIVRAGAAETTSPPTEPATSVPTTPTPDSSAVTTPAPGAADSSPDGSTRWVVIAVAAVAIAALAAFVARSRRASTRRPERRAPGSSGSPRT